MMKITLVAAAAFVCVATSASAAPKGNADQSPYRKVDQAAQEACFAQARAFFASITPGAAGDVASGFKGEMPERDREWIEIYCQQ